MPEEVTVVATTVCVWVTMDAVSVDEEEDRLDQDRRRSAYEAHTPVGNNNRRVHDELAGRKIRGRDGEPGHRSSSPGTWRACSSRRRWED